MEDIKLNLKYHILYRGVLASRLLTRLGAVRLANEKVKQLGWSKADLLIVKGG